MTLKQLLRRATDLTHFADLQRYLNFCADFLEFANRGLQAVIVSRNETQYRFYQFKKDGHFNVTRPLNYDLMYDLAGFSAVAGNFLTSVRDCRNTGPAVRTIIRRSLYTIQQCIGATLDALPAGRSNAARKINGELFERLICQMIRFLGVDCASGRIRLPVPVDGGERFDMAFQHDLIVRSADEIKVIGGVKTSSKDRLAKIFLDKLLYAQLSGTQVPHVAIFLNDVQRKGASPKFGINGTFLSGHFKAFTFKLRPLDGVYYCDLRPQMLQDPALARQIQTVDRFFCDDLWRFIAGPGIRATGDKKA